MLNDNLKLNSNNNSSSLGHHNNYWETLITFSARVVEWNIEPVPIISSKISVSGFIPGCLCQQTSQIYAAFHFTSTLFTTLENISHNNQLRPSLVRSLKPEQTTASASCMYHQFVLIPKLQRIKNAWARLIFREQKFCHVTSPSHNCFQSDVFSLKLAYS